MNAIRLGREPQFSMTNDPDKLWPNGILPYEIEDQYGKKIYS